MCLYEFQWKPIYLLSKGETSHTYVRINATFQLSQNEPYLMPELHKSWKYRKSKKCMIFIVKSNILEQSGTLFVKLTSGQLGEQE